ncbi:MAG: UDP-N-acetylglucosamine--N-acetylmuramyl-(pentapeptide) pyrophosphoryl-undecaprenol N-acetylglucosamine transferase [Candidatus Gracilibacteria bacterium]|nr:UDP-N-acetylglucosamine--N-acetylmuramyl-(pentapeptide) pyrophosphoryl-undecaprenol N-acetylglucosamine transferase [Candidatus Gracilibacteria bacterium]
MTHLRHKEKKVIALTGGSTGGHIFPLLSIYNYLKEEKKYDFIWVGEEEGLEEEIARKNKIPFIDIPAGKIRRYYDVRNFYEPLKNLTGIVFGIYYILKNKIDIVFSKGGYVALPLCISAFILRKKIYIHESDTVSGIANRIIGKIATKVFYTFPNDKTESYNEKYVLTGQILNPELIDNIDNLEIADNERLSVMIMAGSQGSTTIFEAMLNVLNHIDDIDFQVILGEKNMHFREDFKKNSNIMVHDFVTQKRLGKLLKQVDIAITRAGATSLWELNMFGIHSIIIPLEGSAGDHQNKNALYFKEKFGSDVIYENEDLEVEIYKKLQAYKTLRKSGLNLNGFFKPLQIIEKEIEEYENIYEEKTSSIDDDSSIDNDEV